MLRRVVFVNRYFHPDHSATSQIASDLAFHLARSGWEVAAITSRQQYDDPSAALASSREEGVRIERVWSTRFGRSNLPGRVVDYLTFYASAFLALRRERNAVIVAMTDPPMTSVLASLASRRIVNWLQDLFPEVARELGVHTPKALVGLRDWSLRRARRNVAISESMAARVPKPAVIHNWADPSIHPVPRQSNPLRRDWGLGEAFVAGYSGNFGRAHEFETLLRALALIQGDPAGQAIRFLFIGGGAKLAEVQRQATSATFLPYQPRELLAASLSAADVHIVTLEPSLEGLVVPSKFYGAIAAGRPVIVVGARDGELGRLVEAHGCGRAVEKGDAIALASIIRELAADPDRAAAMGARGRELYLSRFDRPHAFAAWERVLEEAAS